MWCKEDEGKPLSDKEGDSPRTRFVKKVMRRDHKRRQRKREQGNAAAEVPIMDFEDSTEWGIKQYELGEHSEELVEQKEAEKYWQAEGEKVQAEAEDQAAAEASDWEHHQIEELQRDCWEQATNDDSSEYDGSEGEEFSPGDERAVNVSMGIYTPSPKRGDGRGRYRSPIYGPSSPASVRFRRWRESRGYRCWLCGGDVDSDNEGCGCGADGSCNS